MKVKLTGQGMEHFTGQMGVVFFEDGVSVNDVSELDAFRLAAVYGAERIGTGESISVSQRLLDFADTPAVTVETIISPNVDSVAPVATDVVEDTTVAQKYTEESLSKIADEQGIAGLREIAEKFGIKGNSIAGLIAAVIKAQG